MLSSAAAAAFAALAVTVAAPAIGDDGSDSGSVDDVAACLREHGLQDAPSGATCASDVTSARRPTAHAHRGRPRTRRRRP